MKEKPSVTACNLTEPNVTRPNLPKPNLTSFKKWTPTSRSLNKNAIKKLIWKAIGASVLARMSSTERMV